MTVKIITDSTSYINESIRKDLDINVLSSPVRCCDKKTAEAMIEEIDFAIEEGDSLGGVFEIHIPPVV